MFSYSLHPLLMITNCISIWFKWFQGDQQHVFWVVQTSFSPAATNKIIYAKWPEPKQLNSFVRGRIEI